MVRCPSCGSEMNKIYHFENGKSYMYNLCKKCMIIKNKERINFNESKDKYLLKLNKYREVMQYVYQKY